MSTICYGIQGAELMEENAKLRDKVGILSLSFYCCLV